MIKKRSIFGPDIDAAAEAIGLSAAELCVRVAKKRGADGKIMVRKRDGSGMRIVQPGQKLRLAEDEFIAHVPPRMRFSAAREAGRKKITEGDMD